MATSSSAIVASINPFPNEVRIAFQAYIQGPNYINRERIPYEKWNRMHLHLDTPDLKPENPTDSRLKYRVHIEFQLVNNKLFRRPDSKFPNPRYTVPESEAFDTIANEHLQHLYTGYIKT
jgi:aspartyl/asparaginyl beta-hydroxylase (cupin superfamily)